MSGALTILLVHLIFRPVSNWVLHLERFSEEEMVFKINVVITFGKDSANQRYVCKVYGIESFAFVEVSYNCQARGIKRNRNHGPDGISCESAESHSESD